MLGSISGGTDVCSGFVGTTPLLPVRAGEITCRCLGVNVKAFDENGAELIGQQGELVVVDPMPSMPVGLWDDPARERYKAAYFDKFPGVWRHGDWITITERGTAVVSGRSDATLNRGGVRMGTQEFYTALEDVPGVDDSLIVHVEDPNGGIGDLLLFVSLRAPATLTDELKTQIKATLRQRLSPRHLPNDIIAVPKIPRTVTGKRIEVPIKRILSGRLQASAVANSVVDPDALEPFVALAATRTHAAATTGDEAA